MMDIKIKATIQCYHCRLPAEAVIEDFRVEKVPGSAKPVISLPDGWSEEYNFYDDFEFALCPKCAKKGK